MIFFVSRYLYFLLLIAFLVIIFLSKFFPGEVLGQNIVFIYTILLLPVVDVCIESLKKESKTFDWLLTWSGLLKFMLTGIIILIGYKKWIEILSLLTLSYFILWLLFRFNSRIAFFVSLFCFAYVALYLLIEDKKMAESISIYAYYYLIIWVIHQLWQARYEKKNVTSTLTEQ